jgi:hypothetical protein
LIVDTGGISELPDQERMQTANSRPTEGAVAGDHAPGGR